ncbi:MmgE/PrpD family protein [Streptomyces durbertensis]|uniref:MmgE/PrpD family protein n=1 Tax=Streptomyces durbertensis TaxID=2448886 RepID=A0ABR6EMB2_9ACTN|nr:MmgE/PrpD family protein [Streptomyces durbertensis]MBB1246471.1 MmgE/PrpD family protein [Streptomyces durbertensis]
MTTLTEELAGWASVLRLDDVPEDVVTTAKHQILSQLAAVRAGLGHPLGRRFVEAFGAPFQDDPARSAFVLASLGSWLHFDDTAYAGHLSNSTVTVPLAYAAPQGLTGKRLLTSIIVANETAARITAATTLGPFRGQSAAFTHVTGAIAGRLRGEDAPVRRWVDTLGLGFGLPPRTVPVGFLDGDAKLFGAATPVRVGLDACDASAVGLAGSPVIFEHPEGFLSRFATIPLPEAVVAGLGTRWHTRTTSFKVHPGGPGMDSAIDVGLELHRELSTKERPLRADDIAEIAVDTSLYTAVVERRAAEYLRGPMSPVSALVFSLRYTLATALLTGRLSTDDFTEKGLADTERWSLADRIDVRLDRDMTRDLFHCEVPFGEALRQAGERGTEWLRQFGAGWEGDGRWLVDLVGELPPPSRDFSDARKVTGARVHLRLKDGRSVVRELHVPMGAIGGEGRTPIAEVVRDKWLATGGREEFAAGVDRLEELSADEVGRLLTLIFDDRS